MASRYSMGVGLTALKAIIPKAYYLWMRKWANELPWASSCLTVSLNYLYRILKTLLSVQMESGAMGTSMSVLTKDFSFRNADITWYMEANTSVQSQQDCRALKEPATITSSTYGEMADQPSLCANYQSIGLLWVTEKYWSLP